MHPCGIEQIFVDALPAGYRGDRNTALYPDGTTISDLKEVRDLMYKLQRPAISPKYVYAHNWKERDLCLFHNRGVCVNDRYNLTRAHYCNGRYCIR